MVLGTTLREDDPAEAQSAATATPYLFLGLDADHPAEGGARYELAGVRVVRIGRDSARCETKRTDSGRPALRIGVPDARASRAHVQVERVMGRWILKDLGSRNGTYVNGGKRDHTALADGDRIEIGRTFFVFRELERPTRPADKGMPTEPGLKTLLPELEAELARIRKVADSSIEILVQGESGTGKELLARQIHALSARPGEFVPVNCGAIPRALVESELFGYQRGAFTGAIDDRAGLIRSSHRGTLFLDEISDLPLPSQTAFLRALESHEVTPLGSTRAVRADFRLIAASYQDVRALTAEGAFRGDLYSRLAGYTIDLPPLRQRMEDLGLLIADLLRKNAPHRAESVRFAPDAARALMTHSWEHNIRELEKCLAVALLLSDGDEVGLDCLPTHVRERRAPQTMHNAACPNRKKLSTTEIERRERIVGLLREHEGNVSAVARDMNKGRTQIRRWILRYDIDPSEFRA